MGLKELGTYMSLWSSIFGSGSKTTQDTSSNTNVYENTQGQQQALDAQIAQLQAQIAKGGSSASGPQMGIGGGGAKGMFAAAALAGGDSLQAQLKKLQDQRAKLTAVGPNANEQAGTKAIGDNFSALQQYTNLGPGASDVSAGLDSQRALASLLQQMQATGGMPTQANLDQANAFTNNIFAPQQTALQQAFQDQSVQASRQAGLMNRSANDPILRAKLAQEQTRQQQTLNSDKTAYSAQYAQQLPQQQLNLAGQLAQVRSGLATQAMQNRNAMLALGSSVQNDERNYRFNIANRSSSTTQKTESSPGLLQGLSQLGSVAASLYTGFQGMGGAGAAAGGGMSQLGGLTSQLSAGATPAGTLMSTTTRMPTNYGTLA
jgi:hypothetical protein